jgi:hypothetical protein
MSKIRQWRFPNPARWALEGLYECPMGDASLDMILFETIEVEVANNLQTYCDLDHICLQTIKPITCFFFPSSAASLLECAAWCHFSTVDLDNVMLTTIEVDG